MKLGIMGPPVSSSLLYASDINHAAIAADFSPVLAYAVANRETIRGERAGQWCAARVVSGDGGHGLFQLTSWVPADWINPGANAHWGIIRWLLPSMLHYAARHMLRGETLIIATADAFNAGTGAICTACEHGEDMDAVTTGHNYGRDVLACYKALCAGLGPT